MIFPLISLLLTAVPALAQDLTSDHNLTSLTGLWSSGSQKVLTGSGFANPINQTFTYPPVAGISISFDDSTGWFEMARYRFVGNGSDPHCITGVMNWFHGQFQLLPNNSMLLVPNGDGYQQTQDPCAAVSNFIQDYNNTELYVQWRIFQDPTDGYKLHMFQFDGAPISPMFQVSTTPNMLPQTQLRNVSSASDPTLTAQNRLVQTGGESSWRLAGVGTLMTTSVLAALATSFLL
ncbi:chaperone for protein-folding within the ER, fungal-domain-containing protein [Abortiporus biennis]|nr:chaperone for protein-folding within the ER, fungal-domain-containing protein [Abortiporus biennis]